VFRSDKHFVAYDQEAYRNVCRVFMTIVQSYAVLTEIQMRYEFYYTFPTPIRMEMFFNGYGVNAFGAGRQEDNEAVVVTAKPRGAIQ
jgi:hypothetical protein